MQRYHENGGLRKEPETPITHNFEIILYLNYNNNITDCKFLLLIFIISIILEANKVRSRCFTALFLAFLL